MYFQQTSSFVLQLNLKEAHTLSENKYFNIPNVEVTTYVTDGN